MKKLLLVFILGLLFNSGIMAQITFERTYGGEDSYSCYSVEQTSDGGYLAAGSIRHMANNDYDFYLMKTDSYGDTLWTRFYDNQPIDVCFSMQLTSDGGCIMAGYTGESPDYKALLVKTDAVGDTLWTRSYTCADATIKYFGQSVQQTSEGEYIITGYTSNSDYSNDIFLIKTNSYGDTLWTHIYDENQYEAGSSVKQTLDGGYIIAGKTTINGHTYVLLIRTDAAGNTLWTQTYGDANNQEAADIQLTSDGGYIICGNVSDETYTKDVYLIKTDDSGQVLWTQAYGSIYDEFGNSVQQTTDGGYVIAGYTVNYPIIDIYLVKTDVLGDTLWTQSYGGENPEFGYSVQQTADEGYIIGGYSNNQSTSRDEVYLLKTDENGMVPVSGWITGNISLDGGSGNVEDIEVTAGDVTVNPDTNGDYTIEIEVGTYDVIATLEDYDPDTINGVIVEEGIITPGINLTLVYNPTLNPPQNLFVTEHGYASWDAPASRDLIGYNVYIDGGYVEFTTDLFYQYNGLVNGTTYLSEVTAVYDGGESEIIDFEFTYTGTGVENILPFITELTGNYPNPFNPITTINYSLAEEGNIELIVFNIKGQHVKTLINEKLAARNHQVMWDGKDENSKSVSSGIYFYKMNTDNYTSTKKMILMK